MNYRPLGRTGVQVSPLCLGTMMFGAWGNTDHDDSIRIIHKALDAGINPTSPARQRLAKRFDMSLPENQRKLDVVQELAKVADDSGLSMIELAIAFVVNHPGVTSAIIGPRTMEQLESQLPAADVTLDAATLDRIDAIVKPGVDLNPADTSYGDHILQPALRRR